MSQINLIQGDCLQQMPNIPSGTVDAIICDPPYGTMKGINCDGYGRKEHDGHVWDVAIDHEAMMAECNRILRPNGALLLFGQQPYTTKLISDTHGNLPFSYLLTWLKNDFANALLANKAPVNYTEDVCVFFKKYDTLNQHPLREYSKKIMLHIGKNLRQINAELGHRRAEHFFYTDSTQFRLCTEAVYKDIIDAYGIDKMEGFDEWHQLYVDDNEHKLSIARTFNLPPNQKYKSNILEYSKDNRGEHPTQKPVALMADLIRTYTNEGDTVLDFTMGSGTTAIACDITKRDFIGIERDEGYYAIACQRLAKHKQQGQFAFD